jgi:hypothetical protein
MPLYGSGFPFTPLTAAQVRLWSEELARSTAVRRQEVDIWEGKLKFIHIRVAYTVNFDRIVQNVRAAASVHIP